MKLFVFACLFALCYAQPPPPPRPEIPETFTTDTEITVEVGDHELKGKGMWGRNAEMKEFIDKSEMMDPESKREHMEEWLGKWNENNIYHIEDTPQGPNGTMKQHCEHHPIKEGEEFPKVWAWIQDEQHTSEERKVVNGTTYIFFTARNDQTGGMIILEVNADRPTVPIMQSIIQRHGHKETVRYVGFMGNQPPSSSVFVTPEICKAPPKRHF